MTDYRKLIGDGMCVVCKKPLGHIFRRVRIDHGAIDGRAVQRQMGLEQFLGSSMLAAVMGPQETLVHFTGDMDADAVTTLCMHHLCLIDDRVDLVMLIEAANDRAKSEADSE